MNNLNSIAPKNIRKLNDIVIIIVIGQLIISGKLFLGYQIEHLNACSTKYSLKVTKYSLKVTKHSLKVTCYSMAL